MYMHKYTYIQNKMRGAKIMYYQRTNMILYLTSRVGEIFIFYF